MTRYQRMIEAWVAGRVEPAPVAALVGFRCTAFEDGTARVEMEAGPRHHNPMGIVHGGIFCDLADAAMGIAVAATLEEGERFATLHLSATYLRAFKEGRLVATGRIVHRGRSVIHTEAEIVDGDGKAVARFTTTCMVVREG